MPRCDHAVSDLRRQSRSRLSETLQRLQDNLAQAGDCDRQAEARFAAWQNRWSERREQISRRLELIDMQLEVLVRGQQRRPQLAVIRDEGHDDAAAV